MNTFEALELIEPLRRALADEKYEQPTPIQTLAIPPVLQGRDLLGCAQTGTGKTAAFALPILQRLAEAPRAGKRAVRVLVLSPTRELASQIAERFNAYGSYLGLKSTVIFGGVGQNPQVDALRRGVDILVATPGRLLDLMQQGHAPLSTIEVLVLDEADRMLDMGFIHDIRRILKVLPARRQNLMFSATMPGPIAELAAGFLHDPVRVAVTPPATTVERIEQHVMFVDRANKKSLLAHLLRAPDVERSIVFTRTKHGANKVAEDLEKAGITAAAIHGNKSQSARVRALDGFKDGSIAVLVATDVASRGLDIDSVSHVFNFDLPNEPESYVHRIGRTARAGKSGVAISFCDHEEGEFLRDIERVTGAKIERDFDQPWHFEPAVPVPGKVGVRMKIGGGGQRQQQGASRSPSPRPPAPRAAHPARGQAPRHDQPSRSEQPRREDNAGRTAVASSSPRPAGQSPASNAPSGEPAKRRRRRGGRGRGPGASNQGSQGA